MRGWGHIPQCRASSTSRLRTARSREYLANARAERTVKGASCEDACTAGKRTDFVAVELVRGEAVRERGVRRNTARIQERAIGPFPAAVQKQCEQNRQRASDPEQHLRLRDLCAKGEGVKLSLCITRQWSKRQCKRIRARKW
jgi:hypothetical protein